MKMFLYIFMFIFTPRYYLLISTDANLYFSLYDSTFLLEWIELCLFAYLFI